MYASTLPRSNWLRRASIRWAWYRHMPASSLLLISCWSRLPKIGELIHFTTKFCMRKQNSMSTRATWQKVQIFKIQDGGRPPFLKSLNRHILVKNRPILMKLGTLHQILNPITVTWPKIEIFKIPDGGSRYFENRFFWPLLINRLSDFSDILYEEAERHVDKGCGTKRANFYNPRWRAAAILKIVKLPYLGEKLLSDFD